VPPALALEPASFAALPGWGEDQPDAALDAFRRSCAVLLRRADDAILGGQAWAGRIADWRPVCEGAEGVKGGPDAARSFFEASFTPWRVTDRGDASGLFTGYYEPLLQGAKVQDGRHRVPLYGRPGDLIDVDLGSFDADLEGQRIAGRVDGRQLVPYYTRAQIDAGALAGRGLELFWVEDPIRSFFMQIQGSGQIDLPDGSRMRVGYAAQNGRPYRAIGRDLVAMGAIARDDVSLQSIRAWLVAHPDQARGVMEKNPSFVFFRALPDLAAAPGPLGALGVPLTPGRSLAVDRRFLPLGAPLWLSTTAPWPAGEGPLQRLVIAQDTGGAIRGPVRGDVFWGSGDAAEAVAGRMQSKGGYWILLPRGLSPVS
jgi:membrane-bound lytic murein transglycosylase A